MRCGRRYALTFLALLLASASLWAFPGRGGAEPVIAPLPSVTMEAPIEEAASPKMPSGTASSETSDELRSSLKAAAEIADKPVIIGGGKSELSIVLDSLEEKLETAEASREAKDAEIAELKEALADAEAETGSKAYIMADGVIGFDTDGLPEFGAGITIGTRIGNSLMVEAGTDYMIGGAGGIRPFSLSNFRFRTGIGWML